MTETEFKRQTKAIGLRVIRLVESLPRTRTADVLGRQVLRSATSVGANYRAACRAQSPRDMIAKLRDVEEEADETAYWLEVLAESGIVRAELVSSLESDVEAVLKMTVASIKTLQARHGSPRRRKPTVVADAALQSKITNQKSKIA